MIITFLNYKDFKNIQDKGGVAASINAGFGIGRNVSAVMKADGKYYLKLSPIASPVYENTSQEVSDVETINWIQRLVG